MLFRMLCFAAWLVAMLANADLAAACWRVLWADNGQAVVVGRNMDWYEDMRTDLWAFPRGIARSGLAGDNSMTWTSKYGSVAASVYGIGTADGINEKGLVANMLWLTEADYGAAQSNVPGLSLSLSGAICARQLCHVAEAVAASELGHFQIMPLKVPGSDDVATIISRWRTPAETPRSSRSSTAAS